MKFIYLMIKEHGVTHKKYLCKKEAESDEKAVRYNGSGFLWKQHIKEFGKHVIHKEILFKCPITCKQLFRNVALDWSDRLNIVKSDEWLNMIPEEGQGGSSPETNGTKNKKWIYKDNERKVVPPEQVNDYLSLGWQLGFPPEVKLQMSLQNKGQPAWNKGKTYIQKNPRPSKLCNQNGHRNRNGHKLSTEERSVITKECLNRPEVLAKFKEPRKPLITAQNINTGEIKTMGRYQWWEFDKINYKKLLKGKIYKGWKLLHPL